MTIMSPSEFFELLRREQEKRERNWEPRLRWQVVQETIAWAADQATIQRNTKIACLENQQRLLAGIEKCRRAIAKSETTRVTI